MSNKDLRLEVYNKVLEIQQDHQKSIDAFTDIGHTDTEFDGYYVYAYNTRAKLLELEKLLGANSHHTITTLEDNKMLTEIHKLASAGQRVTSYLPSDLAALEIDESIEKIFALSKIFGDILTVIDGHSERVTHLRNTDTVLDPVEATNDNGAEEYKQEIFVFSDYDHEMVIIKSDYKAAQDWWCNDLSPYGRRQYSCAVYDATIGDDCAIWNIEFKGIDTKTSMINSFFGLKNDEEPKVPHIIKDEDEYGDCSYRWFPSLQEAREWFFNNYLVHQGKLHDPVKAEDIDA